MTGTPFADRVRAVGLPTDRIIVIASGVLDAMGIREADDIDIAVEAGLFTQLAQRPGWVRHVAEWGEVYYRKDDCEVWSGWTEPGQDHPTYEDLLSDTIEIDGIRYMSLEYVRKWKQAKGREKDLSDIALIDAYNAQEA